MFWPIRAESSGSRFPFPLGVFKRTSEHRCWARTMPARVETRICRLVPAVSVVIRSARNGSWPDINDRSSGFVACESTPLIRPLTPNQACDERPRRRSPILSSRFWWLAPIPAPLSPMEIFEDVVLPVGLDFSVLPNTGRRPDLSRRKIRVNRLVGYECFLLAHPLDV
jgi:hypothetical protein